MKRKRNGGIVLEVRSIERVSWFHFLAVTKYLNKSHISGLQSVIPGGSAPVTEVARHTHSQDQKENECMLAYI